MPKSVYLAGPEVFLPNAREILDLKIALTREAGLVPVSPGDLEHPKTDSKFELGLAISRIDEHLMNSADAIIANLTPFRGIAADTGTCFELGYVCAQGKPAFAYTNVKADHGERTRSHFNGEWYADAAGLPRGPDHILIEDLGFIDNLMLHGGVVNRGGEVVVGDAPVGAELTDMTAFRRILAIAAAKLG
ncbi:nucleoside 2-deoxyribosyltransferase [Devosia sp. ZB163]|uniref:nucleoside 2-deoxyribosyltransferase n=1 Tax=Devosia sp. ZB163 TaxID=3025938 RepID=UPI002362695E|nr:nucleoside 2-deoxyribosyltransferase [Devosia sp. ZB163]MDC9822540.1 nucleoside 2-deoxyribosyltransferase [Devosia sp. ZB163]